MKFNFITAIRVNYCDLNMILMIMKMKDDQMLQSNRMRSLNA